MREVTMRVEHTRAATIESNLGLVHALAKAYRGRGVADDDLVQEGTVGLIQAVDRFDPDRGVKFSTYAAWWIRRALIDALGQTRVIRMPAKAERSLSAVRRAETELRGPTSGSASDEAVAERTGLSAERVRSLRTAARVTASLDEPVGEDGAPRAELVADPDPVDPWRHLDDLETRRRARSLLKVLPGRPREVLVRRYGVAGGEAQTHAQIAAALGIGEERSRQLENEALRRLRVLDTGRQHAAETAQRARPAV
jgi:RNA polymerase sigma factor (sigma-70 family)